MSDESGLPSNKKLFQYVVVMENQAGEKTPFHSILLTSEEANKERVRLILGGRPSADIYVVVNKEAAQKHHAAEREEKRLRMLAARTK